MARYRQERTEYYRKLINIFEVKQSNLTITKHLCKKIYNRPILAKLNVPSNNRKFEEYLTNNRLIHLLPSHKVSYQKFVSSLSQELTALNKMIKNQDYLLIKTLSSYPHITSDIDVVVKSEKVAKSIKKKVKSMRNLSIPIDVNHIISWTEDEEIKSAFIWRNTKMIKFGSLKIQVPNNVLDTLIRIGHVPFELSEFRLGELMHIFYTSKNINWEILRKEAKNNNWLQTYDRIVQVLNTLHYSLYNQNLVSQKNTSLQKMQNLSFPYRISYLDLALAVIEKRSWKKIKGARYIVRDRFQQWSKKIFS